MGTTTKHARLLGVVGVAAIALALAGHPALATGPATIRTGDRSPLTVRAAPTTAAYGYTSLGNGAAVTIVCQHAGTAVKGTQGTSSLWDQLPGGGWVADAYVYTGSAGQVAPTCVYAADPPRANPRSDDDAIDREYRQLGSAANEGWCLRFQAQAFGWNYAGFASAHDQYQWLAAHGMVAAGVPPRGALVWYSTRDGLGHITVSVGAGDIIGTSVNGRVGVAEYGYMSGYLGWSPPYFASAG